MSSYGPSTRDIAKIAGVSKTTVSLCLRNHPKISADTRKRVQQIAKQLGYRVDPHVAKYMSHIQKKREDKSLMSLAALIPNYKSSQDAQKNTAITGFIENIQNRAITHGYQVDIIYLLEPGLTRTKLLRILRTRAIEGVIIGPSGTTLPELKVDLSSFPVAMCTLPYQKPVYHRVESDYFHDTLTALEKIYELGYRAPALTLLGGFADNAHHSVEAAYYYFCKIHPQTRFIPPYQSQNFDNKKSHNWLTTEQPDVVISNFAGTASWLIEIGYNIPEDIGFCLTHILPVQENKTNTYYPHNKMSGVMIPTQEIDGSVVDMVVDQIRRNERGIPQIPKAMNIQGQWQQKASLRKQANHAIKYNS